MAVQSVAFTLNGQTYNLTYDAQSGSYKATINAPATTSYHQTNHVYEGSVTATDDAGNSTTVTSSDFSSLALRVLEKVAPIINVTYPTAGSYITSSAPTVTWTVTDDGSGIDESTIKIKVDGGAAVTTGITKTAITGGFSCSYTLPAQSDGQHTVQFYVDDHDGNSAAATSVSFTIDTVPPTLTISSPSDNLHTNVDEVTVAGITNDATSTPVAVTVNGTTVTVGSDGSFSKVVELTEGENTITVVATDAAGKSSTVTRTVYLDTGAPVFTSVTLVPNPVDAGATYIITAVVTD